MNFASKSLAASLLACLPILATMPAHAQSAPASEPVDLEDDRAPRRPGGGAPSGLTFFDGALALAWSVNSQFDYGSFSQTKEGAALPAAYGPNLEGGLKVRRVNLGFNANLFEDWDINLGYRFIDGAGELHGGWQTMNVQYNGLKDWSFRIGALGLPTNIDSATGNGAIIFMERSASSDLQRGLAAALGRWTVAAVYGTDRIFAVAGLTGGKLNDHLPIDSQKAVVGRFSYMAVSDADTHLLVGVNGTYIIKLPELAANGGISEDDGAGLSGASFSSVPELRLDPKSTALLKTGTLPSEHISQWGVEAAGNWRNFYGQGGYYAYEVQRSPITHRVFSSPTASASTSIQPKDNHFSGWYLQGTWILTGERRVYSATNGAFRSPTPADPFSNRKHGIGAWEVAARYSRLDLNNDVMDPSSVVTGWSAANAKTYTFYNIVRGGSQGITTLGLNWYLNSTVRILANYQWTNVDRLQAANPVTTTGTPIVPNLSASQSFQTATLRLQLSL